MDGASEADEGSEPPAGVGPVTRSRAVQVRVDQLEAELAADPTVFEADCILDEKWNKKAKVWRQLCVLL